jgi:uncharacterized Tic20 family protein
MARRDDDERDGDDEDRDARGPSKDEKQMAMFCHLGLLIGGFLVPLIIWLMKKDESRYIDRNGKEALNFAITLLIGHMIGPFTLCILTLVLLVVGIMFPIQAAMAANRGETYRYPMCLRFIK